MKIVIAMDSFKESLTAIEACQAVASGFSKVFPQATLELVPVADGGEGTTQTLIDSTQGKRIDVIVQDPLRRPIPAFYGILGDGQTAVIEMAAAAGLHLLDTNERNPLKTSTFGVGELITDALNRGIKKIIVGLGGSSTTDGGVGMLAALGVKFLNSNNENITFNGEGLSHLDDVDITQIDPKLSSCTLEVACDVNNPLCGKAGASFVFAGQKGADASMQKILDNNLRHYAHIVKTQLHREIDTIAGAGAAGGLGAGFLGFTQASLRPGIDIVLKAVDFGNKLKNADLVITGEGCIDGQTIQGKTPIGVAKEAKKE